jgi:hypothetical protein
MFVLLLSHACIVREIECQVIGSQQDSGEGDPQSCEKRVLPPPSDFTIHVLVGNPKYSFSFLDK